MPLALGLAAPEARDRVFATLLREIETRGHFSSGAIGTRYLFRALADAGRSDLIYRTITNPEVPGYARQLQLGGTSLAESWGAWTGASQNHFFLGFVTEWFYRDLVGIVPDEAAPGFKHTIIRPHPVTGLSWVQAEHESAHGRIAVSWEQHPGFFRLDVTVPANTTATVHVPAARDARVSVDDSAHAKARGREENRAVFEVGSGRYTFVVRDR